MTYHVILTVTIMVSITGFCQAGMLDWKCFGETMDCKSKMENWQPFESCKDTLLVITSETATLKRSDHHLLTHMPLVSLGVYTRQSVVKGDYHPVQHLLRRLLKTMPDICAVKLHSTVWKHAIL